MAVSREAVRGLTMETGRDPSPEATPPISTTAELTFLLELSSLMSLMNTHAERVKQAGREWNDYESAARAAVHLSSDSGTPNAGIHSACDRSLKDSRAARRCSSVSTWASRRSMSQSMSRRSTATGRWDRRMMLRSVHLNRGPRLRTGP